MKRRSPSRRCSWSSAPLEGVERVADQVGAGGLDRELVVVVERDDELRMAPQRVADDAARSEQVTGPLGGTRVVAERDRERRRPGRTLGQAPELQEAEIGVGRLRQPAEDDREQLAHHPGAPGEAGGELPHRGARALDVGEAERRQPLLGRLG